MTKTFEEHLKRECRYCRSDYPDTSYRRVDGVGYYYHWSDVRAPHLPCAVQISEIKWLEQELLKAREDSELLDWIEMSHWDVLYTLTLKHPRWCIGNIQNDDEIAEGDTLRDAIRAAMKAEWAPSL